MKPSEIFKILDIAAKAREIGQIFNPLFEGPPGVGKSHIIQQWCAKNGHAFVDLRSAYLEAPDVRGFPFTTIDKKGRQRTTVATPDIWPDDGKGIILLEELNRGPASVMNCWMQLLTDRKIDKYEVPEGWFVVGAINPEGGAAGYETNPMDPALKNRFVRFDVAYDKNAFVDYMKVVGYHEDIINYVESGLFKYATPDDLASSNVPGVQYNSPRTMSQLNAVLQAGITKDMELLIFGGILGKATGKDFYDFRHNETPVMMKDLEKNLRGSLAKIKKYTNPDDYKNGLLSITVKDIVEVNTITDDMLAKVVEVLSVEQSTGLIHQLQKKRKDKTILNRLCKDYPNLVDVLRNVVRFQDKKDSK